MLNICEYVPDATPVGTLIMLKRVDPDDKDSQPSDIMAHVEAGPIFNEELNMNFWINAAINFDFEDGDIVIASYDVFTKSFLDIRTKDDTFTPTQMIGSACPFSVISVYRPIFNVLFSEAAMSIENELSNRFPQYTETFVNAYLSLPMFNHDDDGNTTEIPIDIDVEAVDDTSYSLTAQAGPIYGDNEDECLVFLETLEYDTLNPTCYLFHKNLLVCDEPENMGDAFENCEWIEVNDDSVFAEKFFSEYEALETALFSKLFSIVEDNDALVELAKVLEEEGRIEKYDDDTDDYDGESENDNEEWDDEDYEWDDDDEEWSDIDIFVDDN